MKILVELTPNLGALVLSGASVTIETPDILIRIHDWRILRSRSGSLWVSPPTHKVVSPVDGSWDWAVTIQMERDLMDKIKQAILEKYDATLGVRQ